MVTLTSLVTGIGGIFIGIFFDSIRKFTMVKIEKIQEKDMEKFKDKLRSKQYYHDNFFPTYQKLYGYMYDVEFQIERFLNAENSFMFVNVNVKEKIVHLNDEEFERYMFGEDEELVYNTNFHYTLQCMSDFIIECREISKKNVLLFSDIENNIIESFIKEANELMFDLRGHMLSKAQPDEYKPINKERIQKTFDDLKSYSDKLKNKFRERFVID